MMGDRNDFANRVCRVLDDGLDELPDSVVQYLEKARRKALSRTKQSTPFYRHFFRPFVTGNRSGYLVGSASWLLEAWKPGVAVLMLVVGMATMFHYEQRRQIAEIADIDMAVLSDELPPSAYADSGFRVYAADRSRTGV